MLTVTTELFYDRGNHYQFTTLEQQLAPPGIIDSEKEFEFSFDNAEKQNESYYGINARLRFVCRHYSLHVITSNVYLHY